jgi:hypothetical protein
MLSGRHSYAARARLEQQIESTEFDESVSGRRVVISTDGGRIRLRETKRGPKTQKGRRRYTGAWREPKVDHLRRRCRGQTRSPLRARH